MIHRTEQVTRGQIIEAAEKAIEYGLEDAKSYGIDTDCPELLEIIRQAAREIEQFSVEWNICDSEFGECGCLVGTARITRGLGAIPSMSETALSECPNRTEDSRELEQVIGNLFPAGLHFVRGDISWDTVYRVIN